MQIKTGAKDYKTNFAVRIKRIYVKKTN